MSSLTPTALRCEYLVDPLAIERPDPRLGWLSTATARGARQSAYRVVAAATEAELAAGKNLLWDSGKIAASTSAHIRYAGTALASFQHVCWRVQVWDEADRASAWSTVAGFAMGVRERAHWQGQWINSPLTPQGTNAPYFRRSFRLDKPVAEARLYATAKGIYLGWLNGQPVSDEQFAPGWTDYKQRILYRCYDVTALLAAGADAGAEQVLAAQVNDGWYKGPIGWEGLAHRWGGLLELLMVLRVTHTDGSVTVIATDDQWRTTNSPVLASTFLRGEIHDAGLDSPGWDRRGFDDATWHRANARTLGDAPALQAHRGPPVRRLQEIRPIDRWQQRPGVWIYNLGQNVAGRVRMRIQAPAGTTIRLRHGEMVTPAKDLYVDNLRSAISTDLYTAKGSGVEVWEPRFTFHGFQYVEVTGWPGDPGADAITGIVLGSDCPPAGSFSCSQPMVNQLFENIVRTQRANYFEVPTDCPQRDERMGWTGDAQAYIRTAVCAHDIAAFFTKWQQDLRDSQSQEGCFPNVAPAIPGLGEWMAKGDAAWGDAGTICPLTMWKIYDDKDQLADMYPAMVRWVDYLHRTAVQDLHVRYHRDGLTVFGDWLQVDCWTPPEIIMTAFFHHSTRLLADAAEILEKPEDAKRYRELQGKIKVAFNREFVRPDGRVIGKRSEKETQTNYLLALHFDLLPQELRAPAFERLLACLAERDWHLSTGFVGLPYLLPVLSANGRADVAYRLLNTTTYPSWLYPITQGATTIWERWNGWKKEEGPADPSMNSYSHYAYGACGEWLFSDVAGIDLLEPGFKHISIRPRIGGGFTRAQATHECLYGRIASSWRIEGGVIVHEVEIPANTTARVSIPTDDPASLREGGAAWSSAVDRGQPGYATVELGSGRYSFSASLPVSGDGESSRLGSS
ncbi:MAG: family 78 glycoside hydrolase catalytic domain [Planctomycetes bacterium]|nr:family 78 glycoside hydrolase catalytic domain [Planctomycetota bacterium]